jgi:hypothetical protein
MLHPSPRRQPCARGPRQQAAATPTMLLRNPAAPSAPQRRGDPLPTPRQRLCSLSRPSKRWSRGEGGGIARAACLPLPLAPTDPARPACAVPPAGAPAAAPPLRRAAAAAAPGTPPHAAAAAAAAPAEAPAPPEPRDPEHVAELLALALDAANFVEMSLSGKVSGAMPYKRATVRPVMLKGRRMLQVRAAAAPSLPPAPAAARSAPQPPACACATPRRTPRPTHPPTHPHPPTRSPAARSARSPSART